MTALGYLLCILLPLCPLIATAATPEQEMEAEAKKIIPLVFSKCGDDYFSKQTFRYKAGMPYVIRQYKGLTPIVKTHALTKRDLQQKIEWKGNIQFSATKGREFSSGKQWTEWRSLGLAEYLFLVEKKNGVLSVDRHTSNEITPVPCNEVPQG